MATANAIRLAVEPARSLAFGSISGAYMGVGTSFSNSIRILILQNLTDKVVFFSFDGIDDHIPLPSNGYFILDITANKTNTSGFYIGEGERIYVKSLAGNPSLGSVYVCAMFGMVD